MVGHHVTQGNYADGFLMRTLLITQSEICLLAQGSQGAYTSFKPSF